MAIKINRKRLISDFIAGCLVLVFIAAGLFLKPTINWFVVTVFGFCFILLLLKYIFPENKIFNPGGNKSDEEKRMEFINNFGIFTYLENGFSIKGEDFEEYIKWTEITKVTAYKQDLLAYDQIYLTIDSNENSVTIHEDTPGWFQFNKKMETELALKESWLAEVTFPPFEKNETVLYSKAPATID